MTEKCPLGSKYRMVDIASMALVSALQSSAVHGAGTCMLEVMYS